MSDTAIKAEGLGKKYKIGSRKSGDFRESFGQFWNRLKGNGSANQSLQINKSTDQQIHNEFWALKDIDFEIKHGEAVGIIGRNGAGKSTLLKILSRITKPTTGRFEINGRVSSLLEVGTGFHKELTGRENIFLNGAILGMTRREIKQKFDEIVDFSGVEQFIDTPVKHYSSGMLVRLAFSVAAHLEPEILIIDEVLAVGDAEFQKKCLGKMEDVTGQGRTVLFVSHNMGAVKNLCGRGILIDQGKILLNDKDVGKIVSTYLSKTRNNNSDLAECLVDNFYEDEYHKLLKFSIIDEQSQVITKMFNKSQKVFAKIEVEIKQLDDSLNIGYGLSTADGELLYWSFFKDTSKESWPKTVIGQNIFVTELPVHLLNERGYVIEYLAALHHKKWLVEPDNGSPKIFFQILPSKYDSPLLGVTKRRGSLMPIHKWISLK